MIFNIQHVANWEYIRQDKQKVIEKNNKAENAKHIEHLYKEGDQALVKRGTENKYESPYRGPYNIIKVNKNGTVCLKVGVVEDNYNISRLTPYTKANAINHGGECSMQTSRSSKRLR